MQRYTWLADLPELKLTAASLPIIEAESDRLFVRQLKALLAPRVRAALGGLTGYLAATKIKGMKEDAFVRELAGRWNDRQRAAADAADARRDYAGARAIRDTCFVGVGTLDCSEAVRQAQSRGLLKVERM